MMIFKKWYIFLFLAIEENFCIEDQVSVHQTGRNRLTRMLLG